MPTVTVTGMGCEGCEGIVERSIGDLPGVESVTADHESGDVTYDGDVDRDAVADAVALAGYTLADE